MFTGEFLRKLRGKAIRRKALYCLDSLERGILYLSGRLVEEARSPCLVAQLILIVQKLEQAMIGGFEKHVMGFGVCRLVSVVKTAVGFGSVVAREWVLDMGFARYLACMDYNR